MSAPSPQTFFAIASKLIPRDVELTIRQHYSAELDPAELEILRAIKSAIPDAGDRQPGEVLQFTLDAIRAHGASKLIDATRDDLGRMQHARFAMLDPDFCQIV